MESTQAPIQEDVIIEASTPRQLTISVAFVAYLTLFVLALVFRLADLDVVPLTTAEAREGLAAWRVVQPQAAGRIIVPESPLLFLLHTIMFTLMGGSELSLRLLTALAGAALVLSPLLFRQLIGQTRAFLFSVLLTFSPVLLLASRFDDAVIWSLLFGILALWAYWRFREAGQAHYAVVATVLLVGLIFLTEPAGFVLALVLVGSGIFAQMMSGASEAENETVQESPLRGWPWQSALILSLVVVLLVSTGFMLYPAGLSSVSELLASALRGFVTPGTSNAAVLSPLITSLIYEPGMWLFGLVSLGLLVRRGALTFVERFLALWLVYGVVAALIYRGAGPGHALWMVVPLMGLATSLIADLLTPDDHLFWQAPWWSKGLLAVLMLGMLVMLSVHLQAIARGLLTAPDSSLNSIFLALQRNPVNNIWFLITLLFIIVGYFAAASVWGNNVTAKGGALGLLLFGLITGLGTGWNASVSGDPVELWRVEASSRETALLRATLLELSERETRGVPDVPVYALAADDGVLAWLLRDFVNTTYIADVSEARTQGVVLLPEMIDLPDLGGSYVGQRFVMRLGWSSQSMEPLDFLAWWLQRKTRSTGVPVEIVNLWLRQDIYDGVPFNVAG